MSNQTSVSPVAIDTGALLDRGGVVEGAVTRKIKPPSALKEAFFLPDGETMKADAGTAFQVKSGDSDWYLVQFFRPGRLTGPMVYAETAIETPQMALRHCSISTGMIKFAILLAIMGVFTATGGYDAFVLSGGSLLALAFLCGGVLIFGVPAFLLGQFMVARTRGGRRAIAMLYEDQYEKSLRIPLGKTLHVDIADLVKVPAAVEAC